MASCPKCSSRLLYPPSLVTFRLFFPKLTVNTTLDRHQLRCQHCDEMLANRLATEAECPPPSYKNIATTIYDAIQKLDNLAENDIMDEGDVRTLQAMAKSMRLRWANTLKKRDAAIEAAWRQYSAIWGVRDGPQSL